MNKWQKIFLVIGILAIAALIVFPPQITLSKDIKFLPINYGYPIDWLRFFFWFVAIIVISGLGIVVNKSDHF